MRRPAGRREGEPAIDVKSHLTAEYRRYIASKEWRWIRKQLLAILGERCSECGSQFRIEVHHANYDNLGKETIHDVDVLCHTCHENWHEENDEESLWWARVHGYARKRWGFHWLRHISPWHAEEEFESFLEKIEDEEQVDYAD